MSEKTLKMRIQNRHSTGTEWEEANPLLLDGEMAVVRIDGETRLKIGDGVNYYNDLPFIDDPIRNLLSGEVSIDLTGEISEGNSFVEGLWSKTVNVDPNNSNVATYVTRVSLSNINKENKNPDVILRDIQGFEYKGNKRIETDSIYFYSNSTMIGNLIIDFGDTEKVVDISSNISETISEGSWSLTKNVDPSNTGIAKYITKVSIGSMNSKKKIPQIFIKDTNNFVFDINKRVGVDYAYLYSNYATDGKIIIIN